MRLNPEQMAKYRQDGFVSVPGLFDTEEIGVVQAQTPKLLVEGGRGLILETDAKTHRSVLNPHLFDEPFDRLCCHEKVIGPVTQLLDSAFISSRQFLTLNVLTTAPSGSGIRITPPTSSTIK